MAHVVNATADKKILELTEVDATEEGENRDGHLGLSMLFITLDFR